jgi:hypothetical protein
VLHPGLRDQVRKCCEIFQPSSDNQSSIPGCWPLMPARTLRVSMFAVRSSFHRKVIRY